MNETIPNSSWSASTPGIRGQGRTLTAGLGVLLCAAGLLIQKLPLPWPRSASFACVLGMVLFANLFWWSWVDALLSRGSLCLPPHPRRRTWVRRLWTTYMAGMLLPVFLFMINKRWWDHWPPIGVMWIMTWDLLIAFLGVVGAIAMILARAYAAVFRAKSTPLESTLQRTATETTEALVSRRRLLVGASALPFAFTGVATAAGARQQGRFLVRRIQMHLPRLPDRLRGLTISHVSDIHTGRLFQPQHLPAMVEAVNHLKSDFVFVTGDIIDHSNDFLPAACDALAQLESLHGRYLVIGNHDLIDNSLAFVRYVSKREPGLLMDKHVTLDIGGEKLQIAGLGWSGSDKFRRGDPGHERRAAAAMAHADPDACTLALVHHPHAFDPLAALGVDLTLAGHTHGGQLMLTPPGSPLRIGAGSLMFRYLWGEYRKGNSAMYVNAGVGNWFPVRVNAPAEIVQIQLV